MAPHATSLASLVRVKSWGKSTNEMTGGKESRYFIYFLHTLSALLVQENILLVLFSSCMGPIKLENVSKLIFSHKRVSRNCLIHTKRPMKLCNSFFDLGGSISLMALTYSGSTLNPSLFAMRRFSRFQLGYD